MLMIIGMLVSKSKYHRDGAGAIVPRNDGQGFAWGKDIVLLLLFQKQHATIHENTRPSEVER